jgi:hypothetical protein
MPNNVNKLTGETLDAERCTRVVLFEKTPLKVRVTLYDDLHCNMYGKVFYVEHTQAGIGRTLYDFFSVTKGEHFGRLIAKNNCKILSGV